MSLFARNNNRKSTRYKLVLALIWTVAVKTMRGIHPACLVPPPSVTSTYWLVSACWRLPLVKQLGWFWIIQLSCNFLLGEIKNSCSLSQEDCCNPRTGSSKMKAVPPLLDLWLPLCSTLLLYSAGSAAGKSSSNYYSFKWGFKIGTKNILVINWL